jgi:hypothetical protein
VDLTTITFIVVMSAGTFVTIVVAIKSVGQMRQNHERSQNLLDDIMMREKKMSDDAETIYLSGNLYREDVTGNLCDIMVVYIERASYGVQDRVITYAFEFLRTWYEEGQHWSNRLDHSCNREFMRYVSSAEVNFGDVSALEDALRAVARTIEPKVREYIESEFKEIEGLKTKTRYIDVLKRSMEHHNNEAVMSNLVALSRLGETVFNRDEESCAADDVMDIAADYLRKEVDVDRTD